MANLPCTRVGVEVVSHHRYDGCCRPGVSQPGMKPTRLTALLALLLAAAVPPSAIVRIERTVAVTAFYANGLPRPAAPVRPHRERRAALPRPHRTLRNHTDSRSGSRMVASLPGLASLITVTVTPLDPGQNASFASLESAVMGGRGPPRAGPLDPHRASLHRRTPTIPRVVGPRFQVYRPFLATSSQRPRGAPLSTAYRYHDGESAHDLCLRHA
jgi:hypothetical protein